MVVIDILTQSSLTEKKSFVRSFVREVKVTGAEVSISYTMPVSAGTTIEKLAPVPHIVHNGGRFWIRTRDPSLIRTVL